MPDRAPAGTPQLAVEWFVELVIALGDVGYFGNLSGRKADIAATFSRILGVPVCAKRLGLAMTILYRMRSCLIDLVNGKWWTVKLNGIGDRTSSQHQALLAETPAGFQLQPVKVAFRGRRPPVRWEVPQSAFRSTTPSPAASRSTPQPPATSAGLAEHPVLGHAPADAPAGSSAPRTAAPTETNQAAHPAAEAGDAELRHQLTVAHQLTRLAHKRHEEERVAWRREKLALEQRVAVAEGRAQAAAGEIVALRDQHDALLAKLTALEHTAARTGAEFVDNKLEQATAALVAANEHLEAEQRQHATAVERHAVEVGRLTREAEQSRRRELELEAERDQHAAESARLARLADEQHRLLLELRAERDQHAAEAIRPARLADEQHRQQLELLPEHDQHAAEAGAAIDRQVAPVGDAGPEPACMTSVVVTCVAWTVATLTFTTTRRARSRPTPSTSRVRDTCPARLPWIRPAVSTTDLGAQGPRGPPTGGG